MIHVQIQIQRAAGILRRLCRIGCRKGGSVALWIKNPIPQLFSQF
jgi:hypothetical protein